MEISSIFFACRGLPLLVFLRVVSDLAKLSPTVSTSTRISSTITTTMEKNPGSTSPSTSSLRPNIFDKNEENQNPNANSALGKKQKAKANINISNKDAPYLIKQESKTTLNKNVLDILRRKYKQVKQRGSCSGANSSPFEDRYGYGYNKNNKLSVRGPVCMDLDISVVESRRGVRRLYTDPKTCGIIVGEVRCASATIKNDISTTTTTSDMKNENRKTT